LLVTGHENPVTIFFFNEMMCSSLAYSRQKSCNCQDAYVDYTYVILGTASIR
jgi:hypothetical protein